MSTNQQRNQTIQSAVDGLPTELCRLIGDYAAACSHRFTINGFEPTAVQIHQTDDTTTELICVEPRVQDSPWRKFVSESTVADGHSEWTVEVDRPSSASGWPAFGLTTADSNGIDNGLKAVDAKTEWMIAFIANNEWRLLHKGSRIAYVTQLPDRIRVSFKADPSTGLITVRGGPKAGAVACRPKYYETVISEPKPAFRNLRPCIIVSGPLHVVVRSGPAYSLDLPNDSESVVMLSADVKW